MRFNTPANAHDEPLLYSLGTLWFIFKENAGSQVCLLFEWEEGQEIFPYLQEYLV